MTYLVDVSTYKLVEELKQRGFDISVPSKPSALTSPNYAALRKVCQSYIDEVGSTGFAGEDSKQYVFESAMTTFFGSDVWDYINAMLR